MPFSRSLLLFPGFRLLCGNLKSSAEIFLRFILPLYSDLPLLRLPLPFFLPARCKKLPARFRVGSSCQKNLCLLSCILRRNYFALPAGIVKV